MTEVIIVKRLKSL